MMWAGSPGRRVLLHADRRWQDRSPRPRGKGEAGPPSARSQAWEPVVPHVAVALRAPERCAEEGAAPRAATGVRVLSLRDDLGAHPGRSCATTWPDGIPGRSSSSPTPESNPIASLWAGLRGRELPAAGRELDLAPGARSYGGPWR